MKPHEQATREPAGGRPERPRQDTDEDKQTKDQELDEALAASFPASDPVSLTVAEGEEPDAETQDADQTDASRCDERTDTPRPPPRRPS